MKKLAALLNPKVLFIFFLAVGFLSNLLAAKVIEAADWSQQNWAFSKKDHPTFDASPFTKEPGQTIYCYIPDGTVENLPGQSYETIESLTILPGTVGVYEIDFADHYKSANTFYDTLCRGTGDLYVTLKKQLDDKNAQIALNKKYESNYSDGQKTLQTCQTNKLNAGDALKKCENSLTSCLSKGEDALVSLKSGICADLKYAPQDTPSLAKLQDMAGCPTTKSTITPKIIPRGNLFNFLNWQGLFLSQALASDDNMRTCKIPTFNNNAYTLDFGDHDTAANIFDMWCSSTRARLEWISQDLVVADLLMPKEVSVAESNELGGAILDCQKTLDLIKGDELPSCMSQLSDCQKKPVVVAFKQSVCDETDANAANSTIKTIRYLNGCHKCGNGVAEIGEECNEPGLPNNKPCTSYCKFPKPSGGGLFNPQHGFDQGGSQGPNDELTR